MKTNISKLIIHTLLGNSTLNVSLSCLPTLVRYSSDPVRVIIHEDGSLTEAGRDSLYEALPEVEFISRDRADEEIKDQLKGHPLCQEARATNVMFLKMFDVIMSTNHELLYCDSDILFLRPFTGIFGHPDSQFPMQFMTDVRHAYAVRPWHLSPFGRIRMVGRLNTGLMRIKPGLFDLDFIEWLLGQMRQHAVWVRRWYWNEQTCWAALAGRVGCGLWDSKMVILAKREMTVCQPEPVAIHFVSTYRYHITDYLDRGLPLTELPMIVKSYPGHLVGTFGQFMSDLHGRLC